MIQPVLAAITQAARAKGGLPTREDVVAALRRLHYQGIAYARPVEWDAKGDNMAAVIMSASIQLIREILTVWPRGVQGLQGSTSRSARVRA